MPSINSIAVRKRRAHQRVAGFKLLLVQGSHVLNRLVRIDPQLIPVSRPTWDALSIAYASSSNADARTALTQLQDILHRWTADDADVAEDQVTQRYRQLLHLVLDHGERP